MKTLDKAFAFSRNVVKYAGMASFVLLFVTFIIQVIFRYLIKPLEWTYEITVISYIWMVLLGASYATSLRSHVAFTLIYERFSERGQLVISLIANLAVAALFSAAAPAAIKYVISQKRAVTASLGITLDIAFFPYVIFVLFTVVCSLIDAIKAIAILTGRGDEALKKRFEEEQLSEYEIEVKRIQEDNQNSQADEPDGGNADA